MKGEDNLALFVGRKIWYTKMDEVRDMDDDGYYNAISSAWLGFC